ncbi:MAG: hypothetical protein A2289_07950 [Deltaproteobacteria bacterium RIFOXYA12_FULL_58_15]|nr:MAG: hypothetical protein A2289_07950 [Deltaproteobacteria bacterium RIFOXYA12_FULL_58_15]OGR11785.1 MAG: hypothetical protein A2341_02560 [Deltaproteobacteria bacterium RIFOXYB12_FULL_58_9]
MWNIWEVDVTPAVFVMCVSGVLNPTAIAAFPALAGVEAGARSADLGGSRDWVARATPVESLRVTTDLPEVTIKLNRRQTNGVLLAPGQSIDFKIAGAGRLAVVAFQVLAPGKKKASKNVTVKVTADGVTQKPVSFRGKLDRKAKLIGTRTSSVTSSKSLLVRLLEGDHVVSISVPKSSTSAVVELQFYPGKSMSAASVFFSLPSAEDKPVAVAAPSKVARSDAVTETQPWSGLQKRIENSEIRDGEVGSYEILTLADATDGGTEIYAHVTAEKPYQVLCDGPGVVTVRLHRLSTGAALPASENLIILENDVLLQSFDLTGEASETLSAVGKPDIKVAMANEYKLNLGPKLSRFSFQPSESAVDGLAVRYTFAPQKKDSAMSLTLDIGDEFGLGGDLGGGTTITEVAEREKVVKIEVEKVIRVGEEREETVGVAVTAGVAFPTWGGVPAPTAGIEMQWVLPFADGLMALCTEGQAQRHTLLGYGADTAAVELRSRSFIWVVPVRVGPTFRFPVGESVRFAVGARGSFYYLTGSSNSRGGERSDSAVAWGAAGIASFELRLGAGWWVLDAGYGWAQSVDVGDAIRGFSPAAIEVGTRFRFVL